MTPLCAAEFEELMRPLGPFAAGRRVVAAVSGGADSMALALLLRAWGDPLAVVVDHGLRPDSADETAITLARLARLRIEARALRLTIEPGADLGARARTARYAALLDACRQAGHADLVLGHHARDQDETVLLRARKGSGPDGLAGMAHLAWRGEARLLRPLLGVAPARLRATLREAGVDWVEDPGNTDPATARGALRQHPIPTAPARGEARRHSEIALAAELARHVALFPTGHAEIAGPLSAAAWSALVWTVSGRPYPPAPAAVARLHQRGCGTLHGVQVAKGLVVREPASVAPPVPALAGARWDDRFVLHQEVEGAFLGALGEDARSLRRLSGWPSVVLRGLPALRSGGKLLAVPVLAYAGPESCRSVQVDFRPFRPLAGAPFRP